MKASRGHLGGLDDLPSGGHLHRSGATPTLTNHLAAHQRIAIGRMEPSDSCAVPDSRVSKPFIHPHATLALYLGGEATLWSGTNYRVQAGDVILVPEGVPHYAVEVDRPRALTMAVCTACLTSEGGRRLAAVFSDVAKGGLARWRLAPDEARHFQVLLEALGGELAAGRPHQDQAIDSYVSLLAVALLRAYPAVEALDGGGPIGGPSLSGQALAFIADHGAGGISLVDVARHVHRSRAHTAAVVKSETGRTVGEWITHSRLATARQRLLTTDDAIELIALSVGFASTSHFHRVFLKTHEMTPGRWRRAHRAPTGATT